MRFRSAFLLLALLGIGCGSSESPAVDSALADTSVDDAPVDTLVEDAFVEETSVDDSGLDAFAPDAPGDVADAADTADVADTRDTAPCVPVDADAECAPVRVRIVAANLTSGNFQRYEPPGIRILQGLHPDIVLLQEMNYAGALRDFVDLTFGMSFQYMIEAGTGIPNGIVSRYPIVASGEWDDPDTVDRDFAWARIDIPGSVDLWAVSIHLRSASASARDAEAKKLVEYVKANVPAGDYLVIGGDLNTDNESEAALSSLSAVVLTAAPHAVDQAGNNKTNTTRSRPYDWLMPASLLRSKMVPVTIGASSFPAGLVVDTRVYSPIADLAPALATDSAAGSMQHMAVVRDFVFAP